MPDGQILEISDLETHHPNLTFAGIAAAMLVRFEGTSSPLESGKMKKSLVIDWIPRKDSSRPQQIVREIGWGSVPDHVLEIRDKLPFTRNDHGITEDAAIGVMAILIHELENAEICRVLEIGSGGDYLVRLTEGFSPQVEVSGILKDPYGGLTRKRVREKTTQLLRNTQQGFVSVTTFEHDSERKIFFNLHFVKVEGSSAGHAVDGASSSSRRESKNRGRNRK